MPDYKLEPRSALDLSAPSHGAAHGFEIIENTALALASVTARTHGTDQTRAHLTTLLNEAPPGPGEFISSAGFFALWMSDNSWMLGADHEAHPELASTLTSQLGDAASVTEQNDAWVCLNVRGGTLDRMFERLMPVDLTAFQEGAAVRTVIDHIGCFVLCLENERHYRLFAGRSFARSLHGALQAGASSASALAEVSTDF